MRQVLHLLIVNREQRRVLGARYGTRWLLPTIACGERVRAAPLAGRWCAERGLSADIAGQWLGCGNGDAIDWLMAVPVRDRSTHCPPSLDWIALETLASGRSVLDYQTWALARSLERSHLPSVEGPFGTLDWPERMRCWIEDRLGAPAYAWTPYRTSAYEAVLGVETPRGRVYCKGLAADRVPEAILTGRFAAVVPESFARTIALEPRHGATWWLSAECPGRSTRDSVLVATALGRLQQRLRPLATDRSLLDRADLGAATRWAGASEGRDILARAEGPDSPQSWIPMDLDPTNVLNDRGRLGFIDLDESFAGPAPLAMAAFALRTGGARHQAYRAYEQSWSPPLEGIDWRSVEVAAAAFQAWRGWNRLTQHVERGEVRVACEDVDVEGRIRARLSRTLYCR